MTKISLSLVSHTNAGKTTLARTLLGRDVGTVRDAPHVTEFADVFTMLDTGEGERLLLWDTPGFGDSARLVKRLRAAGNPIGWFLSQVWDRWRERPFWAAQQALRNVRDEADVIAATIEHHLAQGIDHLVVTDNGSVDGTLEILQAYAEVAPLVLLAVGGGLYALGAVVYAMRRPNLWPRTFGFHEVFHTLVIAAAVVHFVAMAGWVVPSAG